MIIISQSNPKTSYEKNRKLIDKAIKNVLNSGLYILGSETENFEDEFANYCGVDFGIGVANGTDAIHLSLRSINISPGDEVITVSNTAAATVSGIVQSGAKPVFIDIDEKTYNINHDLIESKINKKTKAIIVVHLYGNPIDPYPLLSIANKFGIKVIEDCAQAHGASVKKLKVGSMFDIATFSFYPTKNLGGLGDGGMILTKTKSLCDKLRSLRQYGWGNGKRECKFHGYNSRLDELQASILRVKLKFLDEDNLNRNKLAKRYIQNLKNINKIILPYLNKNSFHVFHQFVIRVKNNRKGLINYLKFNSIQTSIHYPIPIHKQGAYLTKKFELNITEKLSNQILSLPMYPELTYQEIDYICDNIKNYFIK